MSGLRIGLSMSESHSTEPCSPTQKTLCKQTESSLEIPEFCVCNCATVVLHLQYFLFLFPWFLGTSDSSLALNILPVEHGKFPVTQN